MIVYAPLKLQINIKLTIFVISLIFLYFKDYFIFLTLNVRIVRRKTTQFDLISLPSQTN